MKRIFTFGITYRVSKAPLRYWVRGRKGPICTTPEGRRAEIASVLVSRGMFWIRDDIRRYTMAKTWRGI